jgi:hypothetical protein
MRVKVTQRRSAGVIDGQADGDADSDGEAVVIVAPERHAVLEPSEDWYLEVDIAASGGEHAVRSAACLIVCCRVVLLGRDMHGAPHFYCSQHSLFARPL